LEQNISARRSYLIDQPVIDGGLPLRFDSSRAFFTLIRVEKKKKKKRVWQLN
jgi:hypothetical protein